jgi:hypothetical protein
MNVEGWLRHTDRRWKYLEGKVFYCQFIPHKFHAWRLGIEPAPLGEMPETSQLSYDTTRKELHSFESNNIIVNTVRNWTHLLETTWSLRSPRKVTHFVTKVKLIGRPKCRWRNKLSKKGDGKNMSAQTSTPKDNVIFELLLTALFQFYIFWDVTPVKRVTSTFDHEDTTLCLKVENQLLRDAV